MWGVESGWLGLGGGFWVSGTEWLGVCGWVSVAVAGWLWLGGCGWVLLAGWRGQVGWGWLAGPGGLWEGGRAGVLLAGGMGSGGLVRVAARLVVSGSIASALPL